MFPTMNLYGSNSEPNVNFAYYVCLVDTSTPTKSTIKCESRHSRTSFPVTDKYDEVGTSKDGDDESTIQVQRSVAFHELIDSNRKLLALDNSAKANVIEEMNPMTLFSPIHADEDSNDDRRDGKAKILKLTRNKWLSESRDGSPDARCVGREREHTSMSVFVEKTNIVNALTGAKVRSRRLDIKRKEEYDEETSSIFEDLEDYNHNAADKVLSTVLALDKEHNLFGLSHIKIAAPTQWKKIHRESKSKAIFHQTSIVHVCLKRCCRRVSKTDLPQSLKCGGCGCSSCARCGTCSTVCSTCDLSCGTPCGKLCGTPCGKLCGTPCGKLCGTPCSPPGVLCAVPCKKVRFPRPCPPCPVLGCRPSACDASCTRFGLQITVKKRPEYEATYTELEPKSSCILHKPMAARICNHTPRCLPPSSCLPYLMPCYWPSRAGAPCNEPSRCFHNPPCPKRRAPRSKIVPEELCPVDHPCTGTAKSPGKCENFSCIGRGNEALKKALAEKYGTIKKKN